MFYLIFNSRNSEETERLPSWPRILKRKFVYVLLSPEVDDTGRAMVWLAERIPAMSRVNLNTTFADDFAIASICYRKASQNVSLLGKSTGF